MKMISFSYKNKERFVSPLTWLCRFVVGSTFVFSGFVKGIDPWGTLYKFNEYISAIGLDIWPNLVVVGVFSLCILEFLTGIFILTGSFRRSTPWLAAAIMIIMLPLTLWIAVSEPVADCGCFGDAFILTNWQTFWKNVALTAMTVWLIYFNRRCICLVTQALQWICFVVSGLYLLCIALYGYMAQPMIDFRSYPVGEAIVEDDCGELPEYEFIYEKNGHRKTFSETDQLPEETDGWVFVDRKEISTPEIESSEKNLRIWNDNGKDVTDSLIGPDSGRRFIITMPDMGSVTPAVSWKLNSLSDYALHNDIGIDAVVAGNEEQIEYFKDLSMPDYEIFSADDTSIKELARGNPAVVYTDNGIVQWKTSLKAIRTDDFLDSDTSLDPMNFAIDNMTLLKNITYIYLATMGVLVFLSFTPRLGYIFRASNSRTKPHDNKKNI